MRVITLPLLTLATLLLTACAIPVAPYSPSYDNVKKLPPPPPTSRINDFQAANASVRDISVRADHLESPYGQDLVHYLQTAMQSEFAKAGLLADGGTREITALVEENEIDTGGVGDAHGVIQARFIVKKEGEIRYDKQIRIDHHWESSVLAAIANTRAAGAYPKMAELLFAKLYADEEFIQALKN